MTGVCFPQIQRLEVRGPGAGMFAFWQGPSSGSYSADFLCPHMAEGREGTQTSSLILSFFFSLFVTSPSSIEKPSSYRLKYIYLFLFSSRIHIT